MSLSMKSWCPVEASSFNHKQSSWFWKVPYVLPEEKSSHQYHSATNPVTTAVTHQHESLVQQWSKCQGANQRLIGLKVQHMRWSTCLILLGQPRTRDQIKKVNTIILLEEHSNTLVFNAISLYPQICALFSSHQRSCFFFFLQQMVFNIEMLNQAAHRESETLKCSTLNGMSASTPLCPIPMLGLGSYAEEEAGRL